MQNAQLLGQQISNKISTSDVTHMAPYKLTIIIIIINNIIIFCLFFFWVLLI